YLAGQKKGGSGLAGEKGTGGRLAGERRKILNGLARSDNLWKKRIAIVSTYALIRKGEFSDTFYLCEKFMDSREDLLHKACGWMLREVGKKDSCALEGFLEKWAGRMPRTALRYSLEKFDSGRRKYYMEKKV
ncbi:MAG: DNA alkylation repair protein, partial [Candidatus Micrarchaeota archaeon]